MVCSCGQARLRSEVVYDLNILRPCSQAGPHFEQGHSAPRQQASELAVIVSERDTGRWCHVGINKNLWHIGYVFPVV